MLSKRTILFTQSEQPLCKKCRDILVNSIFALQPAPAEDAALLDEIIGLRPRVVVLSAFGPSPDPLKTVSRVKPYLPPEARPQYFVLTDCSGAPRCRTWLSSGVRKVFDAACAPRDAANAILHACADPRPENQTSQYSLLSEFSRELILKNGYNLGGCHLRMLAEDAANHLKIPAGQHTRGYLVDILAQSILDPGILQNLFQLSFPPLIQKYRVKGKTIYHALDILFENAWEKGGDEVRYLINGSAEDYVRPCQKEMLGRIVTLIQMEFLKCGYELDRLEEA